MAATTANPREIALKVVFWGPPEVGKSTALTYLHRAMRPEARGQLVTAAQGGTRTFSFDFFPQPSPRLRGSALRVQFVTAAGDVRAEAVWRPLLDAASGVIFMADSAREREADNAAALESLQRGLASFGKRLEVVPRVFAWNKRDLPNPISTAELTARLNPGRAPAFETVATQGRGLFEALKAMTQLLLGDSTRRPQTSAPPSGPLVNGAAEEGRLLVERTLERTPLRQEALPLSAVREERGVLTSGEAEGTRAGLEVRRSPTWLHPLASEAFENATSSVQREVWLSSLIPKGTLREQVHEVERDLAAGQNAQAVRRARRLFVGLTAPEANREADEGQAWRALVLGIPVDRYLRFREAARNADAGTASAEDGLFALFFLLDAVLRK